MYVGFFSHLRFDVINFVINTFEYKMVCTVVSISK